MKAARIAFTEELLRLARNDGSIFALATDSRGSVTLNDFAKELPNQFVECGIAEQDAVGIAAGLANAGLSPFVCGPACFFSMRSAEQVKVDVAYSRSNVKIIGVSGGVSYGALGATHHSTQDIALMRALPDIMVMLPSDANQTIAVTRYLASNHCAAYVRMGRGAVNDVYSDIPEFIPGKANVLRRGRGVTIIACGEMVYPSLIAGEKTDATVIDIGTIAPIDEGAIIEAAKAGHIVTVEEHCVNGGLGGAVAEIVCQKCPTKMKIMGLPNEVLYSGTSDEVKAHYGLTSDGISAAVEELRS